MTKRSKTPPPPPPRERVTWSPGDPSFERERWAKDALAYCRLKRRPTAGALASALAKYFNRNDGYAWVSNDVLKTDIGATYVSAVERAFAILDDELGIIERKTEVVHGKTGGVSGRRRVVFPCRPHDMLATLEARSPKRNTRTPDSHSLNPEYLQNTSDKTTHCKTFRVQEAASSALNPEQSQNPDCVNPELNPEPFGEYTGPIILATKTEKVSISFPGLQGSVLGSPVGSEASGFVEALSRIGPVSGVNDLLAIGRKVFRSRRDGVLNQGDVQTVIEHLWDASRRAWLEAEPTVATMFEAMRGIE